MERLPEIASMPLNVKTRNVSLAPEIESFINDRSLRAASAARVKWFQLPCNCWRTKRIGEKYLTMVTGAAAKPRRPT